MTNRFLVLLLFIVLMVWFTQSAIAKVICKEFDVKTEIVGRDITFSLTTDLPDDTRVIVTVMRPYWQKGSSEDYYLGVYYNKSRSVIELRNAITVPIDDIRWKSELEEKQKLLASMGEPFQVSRISDKVELEFVVPINQDNLAFGLKNVNLEGSMVVADHGYRVIRIEKQFLIPFGKVAGATILSRKRHNLHPYELDLNVLYRISKKTPIFSERNPSDHLKAIAEMHYLPPMSVIRILQKDTSESIPYYYVRADTAGDTRKKVTGWIYGAALMGQELSVIEQPNQ